MVKTFAAIWYTCDQDEPSRPFILKLDVPDDSKEAIGGALLAYVRDYFKENGEFYDRESAELYRVSDRPHWGEWEITDGSTMLVATSEDFVGGT